MRKAIAALGCFFGMLPLASGAALRMYFVDVEGGQATLIVSPSGQSMLVDAGWPGNNGRDADRIAAAARLAGVKQIDYMVVTHHHLDHVGGVPELAAKIPVVTFVDHGPNNETGAAAQKLSAAYDQVAGKGKHLIVRPGDRIPLQGLDVEVIAANGNTITKPLHGAGRANAACSDVKSQDADPTENARSVGFILTYGKFRFADLADLTWNKELALTCPNDLIGTVDVYLVAHHSLAISSPSAFVHALHPKVAIMNNGARKGGEPMAWTVIRDSPGLKDIWQLHYSVAGGKEHNSPDRFIANPEDGSDQGHWLSLTATPDGSFTVLNSRNRLAVSY